jgi:hypothetical protein
MQKAKIPILKINIFFHLIPQFNIIKPQSQPVIKYKFIEKDNKGQLKSIFNKIYCNWAKYNYKNCWKY